jgi:hypothetical protein
MINDIAKSWSQHGAAALEKMAATSHDRYVEICTRLIPKDVALTVQQRLPGNLEPTDWDVVMEVVDAVRQAIPDAGQRQPGEVMQHVLEALRSHDAQLIEATTKADIDGPNE